MIIKMITFKSLAEFLEKTLNQHVFNDWKFVYWTLCH